MFSFLSYGYAILDFVVHLRGRFSASRRCPFCITLSAESDRSLDHNGRD